MPTNADGAAHNLEMVIKAGARAAEASLAVIGILITNQVKINITHHWPPASQPKQPPHLRTGGLRLSYRFEITPSRGRRVPSVSIYSDRATMQPVPPPRPKPKSNRRPRYGPPAPPGPVIYASYLEFGTSRMAARPHLRPAVEQIRPLIPGVIRASWAKGVRAANSGSRRV